MDSKTLLLIDGDINNTVIIDKTLAPGSNYSLFFATNAKHGLDLLMGDIHPIKEMYPGTKKLRPEVLILNKNLPDMTALEFLGIIRKYYTLRNVKVFVLADALSEAERNLFDALHVSGYLQTPLDEREIIRQILPEVNADERTYWAVAPLSVGRVMPTNNGNPLKKAS